MDKKHSNINPEDKSYNPSEDNLNKVDTELDEQSNESHNSEPNTEVDSENKQKVDDKPVDTTPNLHVVNSVVHHDHNNDNTHNDASPEENFSTEQVSDSAVQKHEDNISGSNAEQPETTDTVVEAEKTVQPVQAVETGNYVAPQIVQQIQPPQTVAYPDTLVSNNSIYKTQPIVDKKKMYAAISVVAVALIICIAYVAYSLSQTPKTTTYNNADSNNNKQKTFTPEQRPVKKSDVNYSQLKTISSKDGRISISAPKEMQLIYQNSVDTLYGHKKPNVDIKKDAYSQIALSSAVYGSDTINKIKPTIINQLKAKSGEVYDGLKESFKEQGVESFVVKDVTDFRGGVKVFIDSALDKNGNEGKGVLILLFSEDTYYGVSVVADSEVWNANEDKMNQIIDSIKFK